MRSSCRCSAVSRRASGNGGRPWPRNSGVQATAGLFRHASEADVLSAVPNEVDSGAPDFRWGDGIWVGLRGDDPAGLERDGGELGGAGRYIGRKLGAHARIPEMAQVVGGLAHRLVMR